MISKTTNKFSPEVRPVRFGWCWITPASTRRAGRGITSIAAKIGRTPQTLHDLVGQEDEVDCGQRAGVPTDMAEKLKALERENRELRQANEILRKPGAYFAMAELDRRSNP